MRSVGSGIDYAVFRGPFGFMSRRYERRDAFQSGRHVTFVLRRSLYTDVIIGESAVAQKSYFIK